MAEKDHSPTGGLGFEQSSRSACHDHSNATTTISARQTHSASDSSDLLCSSLMVESDYSANPPESTHFTLKHLRSPEFEDLDTFNLIEPPPLDWRSESSSEACSVAELESCSVGEFECPGSFNTDLNEDTVSPLSDYGAQDSSEASDKVEQQPAQGMFESKSEMSGLQRQETDQGWAEQRERKEKEVEEMERKVRRQEMEKERTEEKNRKRDLDHSHIQSLLSQLHLFHPATSMDDHTHCTSGDPASHDAPHSSSTLAEAAGTSCQNPELNAQLACADADRNISAALLFSQDYQKDLLQLLEEPDPVEPRTTPQLVYTPLLSPSKMEHTEPQSRFKRQSSDADEVISMSHSEDVWHRHLQDELLVSGITEEHQWEPPEGLTADQSSKMEHAEPRAEFRRQSSDGDEMISVSHSEDAWHRHLQDELLVSRITEEHQLEPSESLTADQPVSSNHDLDDETQPAYKNVPGPCDPEDLLDGVIFGAKYLGSTQLQSERNPSTNARMAQAQEAVDRIKAPEGESQPMTEVDLFISTQRIKVLSADTQEAMMDHALQMISYIADIGKIVVLMARRKPAGRKTADPEDSSTAPPKKCWMICHVFSSEDAQIIAQAIGQAFGVAYQQFLYTNGIKASELRPGEYSDYLGTQELYNGDLVHFSRSENIREVCICKKAGEILGLAIVESGWGSILPTVVVANLLHGGPAERSGELSIGDRIMSVNGTSMVGLPITTCQSIIRDLKSLSMVKLSIVHCPPVTMAIIKRPDPKYQLGFSVEDGIICSLMRGGIAERGGIRVGHRIIEINGQSVVATPHEKIIHILTNAVGEIHLKTMPTSTYRLLTGLDQPVFL